MITLCHLLNRGTLFSYCCHTVLLLKTEPMSPYQLIKSHHLFLSRCAQTIMLLHPLDFHSQRCLNTLSLKHEHQIGLEGTEFGGITVKDQPQSHTGQNTSSSLKIHQTWGLGLNSIPDLPFAHCWFLLKRPIKALNIEPSMSSNVSYVYITKKRCSEVTICHIYGTQLNRKRDRHILYCRFTRLMSNVIFPNQTSA